MMNYDQTITYSDGTDEDFMRPMTSIGEVLVNAAIASGSVIAAMQNKSAYYPLPSGQSIEMVGRTRRAALAYRLIDENDYLENSFERTSNTKVAALTSINGQRQKGEHQASFMARVQVLGIVQQETDVNGSKLFNVHVGGVYTLLNNSNRDIVAGDWLMAYAPEISEINQGGRGKDHDANGYYELWIVPYDPQLHQLTTAHVYACLSQSERALYRSEGKAFMDEYVSMCDHLLDSFMDVGIVFLEFMVRQGFVEVKGKNSVKERADTYAQLLTKLGNSRFFVEKDQDNNLRQVLINALFLDRINRTKPEYTESNYFPATADRNQRQLREAQLEAVSLGMTEQAGFNRLINKNVFARAITSASPKKNFEAQLCAFMSR